MLEQRDLFDEMFSRAGIAIDGPNPWDIQITDESFYTRLLRDHSLGLGEAYMEGLWRCRQLGEFIYRLLKANLDREIRSSVKFLLPYATALLFNPQSRRRARQVAAHHYDLGNDLFMSFLDPYNQYSCAYFDGTNDLAEAQQKKLDLICRKLNLKPHDHLLDIGCGWGGLAKFAAEHYGCTVTGVTISREQARYAAEYCKGLPVEIRECEYRDLLGVFDKIVSVGMFEHVGQKNYRTFMQVVDRCLKDDGIFLLHTIGGNASQVNCEPWLNKYIFPNGMLPSIAQIGRAVEDLFVMEDWHNLGPHYDRTLVAWHQNFQNNWDRLEGKYDERFKRMWEYYLLSCAGAFRARKIQLWQLVLTKCGTRQPDCRKQ
ncbi:MAG: cyclopropane fatty acyl phospholipid synthase [Syntrophales bacterium]